MSTDNDSSYPLPDKKDKIIQGVGTGLSVAGTIASFMGIPLTGLAKEVYNQLIIPSLDKRRAAMV